MNRHFHSEMADREGGRQPTSRNNDTKSAETKSQKRWKILREALLHHRIASTSLEDPEQGNPRRDFMNSHICSCEALSAVERTKLAATLRVDATSYSAFVGTLEECLLAHLALSDAEDKVVSFTLSGNIENISNDQIERTRSQLGLQHLSFTSPNAVTCEFTRPYSDFFVRKYTFTGREDKESTEKNVVVHVREPSYVNISLEQLTSHRQKIGVDYTGNVRLWDCSRFLAWALLQERSLVHEVQSILELGAGMAGLASLSCFYAGRTVKRVVVTDGHPDCVLNNKVNIRMMEAATGLHDISDKVVSHLLKWSFQRCLPDTLEAADLTLISDCLHFQHFHRELLWTIILCTKVNGAIWTCQPERGDSLNNFLHLVTLLNEFSPILETTEKRYPVIDSMLDIFAPDNTFDKSREFPRIFMFKKLRAEESSDLELLQRHSKFHHS